MDSAAGAARLLLRARAHARRSGGASAVQERLTPRQDLARLALVVDEHVLAARHVLTNGRDDFIFRHIGRDDAARDLALVVDPFDDPATAAPWLLQRRGDAASAQVERGGVRPG